jgi:penicillin amidase
MLDLHKAFAEWTDRVNNYAVGDVDGNFGYLHEGKIPIRGEANGWRAVPGWTGEFEWSGFIPHDEMPKAINPDQGYAVTCNQRVAGADFPYYVGLYFAAHHRAERIIERIGELPAGQASIDDMASIHAERVSIPAIGVRDALLTLDASVGRRTEALDHLRDWDGSIDRDLVGPTISGVVRSFITTWQIQYLFGDSADEVLDGGSGGDAHRRLVVERWMTALEDRDDSIWPDGHPWSDVLGAALDNTIAVLTSRLGGDMGGWVWGAIHYTEPVHPLSEVMPDAAKWLDPPSVRAHGDADTPLAGSFLLDLPFTLKALSVNRYIFDPSNWKNSRWIVPLGSSGHPASPHYSDQATAWSNVEYIPQMWDWDDIRNAAESTQILEPS